MITKTIKLSDLKAICHMAEMHYDMLQANEGKMFSARDKALKQLAQSVQTSFRTDWTILNDIEK